MRPVHRSLAAAGQALLAARRHGLESFAATLLSATTAVALPLMLYLRTMAPTVYGLDSAELTAGAYLLGIVHAPGSPTYLLLGHLFTWLPWGDIGYRVNLLSACAAAAAVGFVYATLFRLTRDRLLSLTGALYLATTYYFWISALAAEIYALHVTFLAALLWLALNWYERRRPATLYALCLVYGIGLGNHLSLSVLAPGFAYIVLVKLPHPRRQIRLLAVGTACILAGWSIYLYLPLRAAAGVPMNYARDFGIDVTTWRGFWWMVTGSMFGAEFFGVPLRQLPSESLGYAYRLWSNFLGLGCLLGFVGLLKNFARQRDIHTALALMLGGHLIFVLTYAVGDKELMLLPTFLIWGLWATLGARDVARYIRSHTRESAAVSGAMLLLIMGSVNVALNFDRVDISADWSARARGELLMRWLPADVLYLATWADAPLIDYLQLVEGWRPDVKSVNVFLVRGRRRQALVDEQLAGGGLVYASAPVGMANRYFFEFDESCECYRVRKLDLPWCPAPPPPTRQSRMPPWPLVATGTRASP